MPAQKLLLGGLILTQACLTIGCAEAPEEAPLRIRTVSELPTLPGRGFVTPEFMVRTPHFGIVDDQWQPLLTDEQIASYDWSTHTIHLKPGVTFPPRPPSTDLMLGTPFSVIADGGICYRGVFMTAFSSHTRCCPIIYDCEVDGNEGVRIKLGPTISIPEEFSEFDPREDERVMDALVALGKMNADFARPDSDRASTLSSRLDGHAVSMEQGVDVQALTTFGRSYDRRPIRLPAFEAAEVEPCPP